MSAHGGNTKDDIDENIERSRQQEDKSKRKKGIDRMEEAPETIWSQSADDVIMILKIPDVTTEVLKEADVTFTDSDLTVKLPDGRNWTWVLYDEIHREDSKVKVKKRKMSVHMKKKVSKRWPSYQSQEEAHIPVDAASAIDNNSDEALDHNSLGSGLIEDAGTQSATENTDLFADSSTLIMEPKLSFSAQTSAVGSELDTNRIDPSCADSTRFMAPGESHTLIADETGFLPPAESHTGMAGESGTLPPAESHTGIAGESGTLPPTGSRGDTDLTDENGSSPDRNDENTEVLEKEEEPVVNLQLIKHDFIEKDDTFVVHIYVKGVNKDCLLVKFDVTTFFVKFQTNSSAFLKLHEGATDDTKFCWQIKLRGEITPEKCKVKVTPSCIELYLFKKEFDRWGDLEALKRKESSSANKVEDWMSLRSVTPKAEGRSGSDRQALCTEMKQNIERDNLKDKLPDGGPSSTPTQQKPTCKVQPLNKQAEEKDLVVRPPGFTGLENLGNTCFMNGVLQCLVNTRELRDFFIEGSFQKDLNTDNILGSGGKLAVAFAVLCKTLWSGKHYSYAPSKLKLLVAQKASQFTGFAQHDAQEFLAFLLDGLHEDLNRVKKKPYTETVEDGGRPDEVVANEAWAIHKKRNDSFIVDLFQGQYKSKLVCPHCGKVSITFDPFLYLSLPLPKRQRLLPVTFMWKDPYKKPVRYMLRMSKEGPVEMMKELLQRKTAVHPDNIRVFEAYKGRIHKIFGKGSSLHLVQANDLIIACEVLSEEVAGEPVHEVAVIQRTLMPNQFPIKCSSCKKICPEGSKLKRCTKCYKVGYCDPQCQKDHWTAHKGSCRPTPEPVGTPFIISIPESRATFSKLCQLMESYARYSVDVFQPPMKVEPAPKLTSRLSSSNLSNSSQSSGSQNSLDSQSSFSSSCTITAEQEQSLEDTDLPDCDIVSKDGSQSFSGDSAGLSQTGSSLGQTDSGINFQTGSGDSFKPMILKAQKDNLNETARSDSGYSSVTDLPTRDTVGSSLSELERGQDKEFTSPVKPVLGIQTGDLERSTPMFFIKPVDADGNGLTGAYGDRLEDKGDIPLDLSEIHFLSVDWKNNDKLKGYVLVQSKDLDFDNDVSMMTATAEENNVTLEQCLELFTEPEKLNPEEAWYCPQCKEHREATKQLSTWKLPHTLIIQLKRFSFRNFIWRDKIDKMVEFPTRGLDLSAFYIGSRPSNEPPPIYDLYGVVNHHGGILGGHYTSHVRCAEISANLKSEVGWRLCDDSRVSAVSHEKNVVTRAAYLLFYRRRQVFVPPLPAEISAQSNEMSDQSTGQNKQVDQMSEIYNKFSEQRDNKTELPEKSEKIYKKSAKMSEQSEKISEHSNKTNEEEDEVYESACSDIEETSRSDTVENTERLVIDFTRNEEADRSGDESGGGGSDKVVGEPTGAGLDDNEEVEELGYTDMDSVD